MKILLNTPEMQNFPRKAIHRAVSSAAVLLVNSFKSITRRTAIEPIYMRITVTGRLPNLSIKGMQMKYARVSTAPFNALLTYVLPLNES